MSKQTLADVEAAERGILGCMIVDPTCGDIIEQSISAGDFVNTARGQAYQSLVDFKAAGGPIGDITAVLRLLTQTGTLASVGGAREAAEWTAAIPGNLTWYLKELRKAKTFRRLDDLATAIRGHVDGGQDPDWIAGWIESQVNAIIRRQECTIATIGQAAQQALDRIAEARSKQSDVGRSSGLPCVDQVLGGMFNNDLIILAARPSIGKTAMAVQLGMNVASSYGRVLMVSLEMSQTDIAMRLIARNSGVPMNELRNAKTMEEREFQRIGVAVEDLQAVQMSMLASRNVTAGKIRAAAKLQRSMTGLEMVIVDYIGLVKAADFRKPRWEQISEISSQLKDLAMELEIPVVVLCQLNRTADKEKPMLSHLRDSGSIEQDADVVMLLHREDRTSTEATLDIAKNRQGAVGAISLRYEPTITTFFTKQVQQPKEMKNYEPAFAEYETTTNPDEW